ncbi:MAG: phosphodiesterase [Hyphomicrobiales bacterium]
MDFIDQIFARLSGEGAVRHEGAAVSQLEHALQTARLAEMENAPDALVIAALLHDYGHLIAGDVAMRARRLDLRHEDIAARHLSTVFPAEVTEPIRLHVAAKRYLCTVDPDYTDMLSPASRTSLKAQGGAFNEDGVHIFRRSRFWVAAVRLRTWDDLAKAEDLTTGGLGTGRLEDYRARMQRLAHKVAAVA